MVRAGGKRRKNDLGLWEHVEQVMNGKRVKCKRCGYEFAKNVTKIRYHINQIKGKGVRVCDSLAQSENNLISIKGVASDLKENLQHSQGPRGTPTSQFKDNPSYHPEVDQQLISLSSLDISIGQGSFAQPSSEEALVKPIDFKAEGERFGIPFLDPNSVSAQDLQEARKELESLIRHDLRDVSLLRGRLIIENTSLLRMAFCRREDLKSFQAMMIKCLTQHAELSSKIVKLNFKINDIIIKEEVYISTIDSIRIEIWELQEKELLKEANSGISTKRAELTEKLEAIVADYQQFQTSVEPQRAECSRWVEDLNAAKQERSEVQKRWRSLADFDFSFVDDY